MVFPLSLHHSLAALFLRPTSFTSPSKDFRVNTMRCTPKQCSMRVTCVKPEHHTVCPPSFAVCYGAKNRRLCVAGLLSRASLVLEVKRTDPTVMFQRSVTSPCPQPYSPHLPQLDRSSSRNYRSNWQKH